MARRVQLTKPRRRIVATCSEGCALPGKHPPAGVVRRHVFDTGHTVTVTDTRRLTFLPVDDDVVAAR